MSNKKEHPMKKFFLALLLPLCLLTIFSTVTSEIAVSQWKNVTGNGITLVVSVIHNTLKQQDSFQLKINPRGTADRAVSLQPGDMIDVQLYETLRSKKPSTFRIQYLSQTMTKDLPSSYQYYNFKLFENGKEIGTEKLVVGKNNQGAQQKLKILVDKGRVNISL
jgi:hypothetical protein